MHRWNLLLLFVGLAAAVPVPEFYPEEGEHFEGDILLYPGEDPESFNAIFDKRRRWPDGVVPFVLDSAFTESTKTLILNSLAELSEVLDGCAKFVERDSQKDYINVAPLNGCFSAVGRRGGSQRLSIGKGCERKGIIQHEFLHALGFFHEHSRGDRDNYVTINWENIREGKEHNFRKLVEGVSVDHLGTRYDYGSIMHYRRTSFAIDRKKDTITPTNPNAEIGQRERLSPNDIAKVKKLYNC